MGLHPGDKAWTADGREFVVVATEKEEGTQRVFDVEVEGNHTYFVGAAKILAHNACGPSSVAQLSEDELIAAPAERGQAPIGSDGHPVEIHHEGQDPYGPASEMTRTQHRLGDNFSENHPNTGGAPSAINRAEFAQ